jgi:ABC-type multidrug transport system fused ATPase/permease subunit
MLVISRPVKTEISYSEWKNIRKFIGPQVTRLIYLAVVVGVLFFATEFSFVFIIQGFLKTLGVLDPASAVLPSWYPGSVIGSVTMLTAFGILRGGLLGLKSYTAGVTYQVFNRDQRERILSYGLANATQTSTSELITLFSERVAEAGAVLTGASQVVLTSTSTILILAMGFKLAPVEMLLGLGMLAILVLPLRSLNRKIHEYGRGQMLESEQSNQVLTQGLKHHFFLKIYGLIPSEIEKGKGNIRRYSGHFLKFQRVLVLKGTIPQIAGLFVISVITFVSTKYLHTPGVKILGFFYLFIRMAQSVAELSTTVSEMRVRMPGFWKMYSWNATLTADERSDSSNAKASNDEYKAEIGKKIRDEGVRLAISGVGFGYPGQSPLFENLNLTVNRGDVLVIQGESGAGKSTLLTLALGMNQPQTGEISVNGYPMSQARSALTESVAYVGPEPYLIHGTVRENLLYGLKPEDRAVKGSDSKIWASLEKAQLTREIRSLPGQLDEFLYEHTQLSTGQKQRLAITRAILREPKLLVLDEASANLDSTTELKFISAIQEILRDLTTIIISHKPTFNAIATQKIDLEKR